MTRKAAETMTAPPAQGRTHVTRRPAPFAMGPDQNTGADVVLYAISDHTSTAVVTLTSLRAFAARQGFNVVHEVYDLTSLHVPARRRAGWRTVERVITSRRAAGLVAPAANHISAVPAQQSALRRWLLSVSAFAAYLDDVRKTAHRRPGAADRLERHQSYTCSPNELGTLRNDARTHLTLVGWPGDLATAIQVLTCLTHIPVARAPLAGTASSAAILRLTVTEREELVIELQAPQACTDRAAASLTARSLTQARLLGAEISCGLSDGARATTVRARLRPSSPDHRVRSAGRRWR